LSFVVTCPDLQAPEGQILYPHIDKRLAFQQDGGISLHISDWYDETRTNFALGDSLSWTDNDVVCGMTYEYAVRIDYAVVNDPGRNSASAVGIAGTAVYQEVEIPPLLGCPENDPSNVSMTATLDAANVMQVDWAFQANAAWPQDPPLDNGLRVQLLRYSPFFDEQVIFLDEVHSVEEINAQPAFHVSDADLQCNNQYWYTLQVIAADANLDLVSPGWIVRQPVEAPVFPCEVGRLDDWFDVSTFWYNDRYHRALVEVEVPDGAQFPTGDIVEIRLEYYLAGDGECRQAPCDGNYHVFDSKRLQNGRLVTPVYEDFFDLGCGGDEILVRMAIAEDGVGVEYSNTVSVYNEPCPPHTPQIVSLFATTEDCPANVERCVYIEWEPYQQDLNGEENAPAVQLVVQRRNLNETGYTEFPVLLDSTSFVDTNPLSYNLNAQPGFQCQAPVLYRLVAYGENGRFQGASPLQLYGLTCDGPWNTHQEAN